MAKKWIAGLMAGTFVLVGGYFYVTSAQAGEIEIDQAVQKTAVLTRSDIVIDFVSDGNVEIPIYDLSFESTGTVAKVNVKVGDYVEVGTVLAELEKDDLERALIEAQLDLQVQEKQQTMSSAGYSDNEQNYKYQSGLLWDKYEKEKESLSVMKTLKSAYPNKDIEDQAKAVEDAYQAYENYVQTAKPNTSLQAELDTISVEKARMKIDEIQEKIDGMIIRANVSGWIVDVNYSAGEVTEMAQPVILIEEDGPIYVQTYVPEDDIGDVTLGQKSEFEADAVAGLTYTAVVEQVSRAPKVGSNGLVSYEVLLKAQEADRQLMDGMTATVNFILIEKKDVLTLPNDALVKKEGGQYVQVLLEDGQIVEQKIYAGFTDGSQVEILKGLEEGTTVVYEE